MILEELKPENWIAIGSAFLTALITGVGLYVGPKIAVKRSIEQFRSQKWWENQASAYAALLSRLAILKHHNRVWYAWAVEHEDMPEEKKGDFAKDGA